MASYRGKLRSYKPYLPDPDLVFASQFIDPFGSFNGVIASALGAAGYSHFIELDNTTQVQSLPYLPSDQNQSLLWAITDANHRIAELEARHKDDIDQLKSELMDEIAELKGNTVNKTAARPGGIEAHELATIKSDISKLKSETAEIITVKGEIAESKDKQPDLSLYCLKSDLKQFHNDLILKLREKFGDMNERLDKVGEVLLSKEDTTENLKKLAASTVQAALKETSFTEHIKKVAESTTESKIQAMLKEERATRSTAEKKRKREASVESRRPKPTPNPPDTEKNQSKDLELDF